MKNAVVAFAIAGMTATASPAMAQNIVTNGGFETGTFAGWTQFGNTADSGVDTDFDNVRSGDFGAYFGAVGRPGGITQTLDTVAGRTYNISFYLNNSSSVAPNSASFSFGGLVLGSLTNSPEFPFTYFSYSALATSARTDLSFAFRHDDDYWGLDDVSVIAQALPTGGVPEPSTWALMIIGFGAVGGAMRRRSAVRTTVSFA